MATAGGQLTYRRLCSAALPACALLKWRLDKDLEMSCSCYNSDNGNNNNSASFSDAAIKQVDLQQRHTSFPSYPSLTQRYLYKVNLASLPIPRKLNSNDPVFTYRKLQRGLVQRRKDEQALKRIQQEIQQAASAQNNNNNTAETMKRLFTKVTEVAYGKGITAQIREDFLIQNGCTGMTKENLSFLMQLGESRGYVEIGAGHGQWAKRLTDAYHQQENNDNNKAFEFVLAYDDMSELPLDPAIYHSQTVPAQEYFYSRKVRKILNGDIASIFRSWSCRGRILLLVYPSPGNMALDTLKAFLEFDENDTVVYVGEGKGGANANDAFFEYFLDEKNHWALIKEMNVLTQPGDKGYEKLFVFKRKKKSEDEE